MTFQNDQERGLWANSYSSALIQNKSVLDAAEATADKAVEAFRKRNTLPVFEALPMPFPKDDDEAPSILTDVASVPSAEKLVEPTKAVPDDGWLPIETLDGWDGLSLATWIVCQRPNGHVEPVHVGSCSSTDRIKHSYTLWRTLPKARAK